ncbi:MAG: hypothetical protein A2017_17840 [Lentisphaerae bacterium GWF2_44_16]|nr:MAG: hypothetical protein A2017_17840 [Lentisphaerae bacterium GWF2_44_16]
MHFLNRMNSKFKTGIMLSLCFGFLVVDAGEKIFPKIYFTSDAPAIDGNINKKSWEQADVMTGFTEPQTCEDVKDQSEARFLFDDKNLYITLKADETFPSLIKRNNEIFQSDSFEIFIKPQINGNTYYQIAVSVSGEIYFAQSSRKKDINIISAIKQDKTSWSAELSIPLKDLELDKVKGKTEILVNVVRNDWAEQNRAKNRAKYSSFAPLEKVNFHVPEEWAKVIMSTEKAPSQKIIMTPSMPKNLLRNPDFKMAENNLPDGWKIPEKYWKNMTVQRQETMAMSGEWHIIATGNAYVVLTQNIALKAGHDYTVQIKARSNGDTGILGIQQILKGGKSSSILWNCELTKEFQNYNVLFKAKEDLKALSFYNIHHGQNPIGGIEISSIRLYEGKISPLQIRQYIRRGLTRLVPGTEKPFAKNIYGKKGAFGKIKALVVSYSFFTSLEFYEILSGLNIDADILVSAGAKQDVYYTESNPEEVRQKIEGGKYELYITGSRATEMLGRELEKLIISNVKNGAGLLFISLVPPNGNSLKFANAKYASKPLPETHPLIKGIPEEIYPGDFPFAGILETELEKGCIVSPVTKKGYSTGWNMQFRIPVDKIDDNFFPYQKYFNACFARLFYYAAKHKTFICDFNNNLLELSELPEASFVEWQIDNKAGEKVAEGKEKTMQKNIYLKIPALKMTGNHVLICWLKNREGEILDCALFAVNNKGPVIKSVKSKKEFYEKNDILESEIELENIDDSMVLSYSLSDFSGRLLETENCKAANINKIKISLKALPTNLGYLLISLSKEANILDVSRTPVYVPENDRERIINDFNVSVWPEGCTNPHAATLINQTLKDIGISVKNHSWHILSLKDGLGTSRNLERHEFWGTQPVNNIRKPSLCDMKIIDKMISDTKAKAVQDLKYGPVVTQVVDEPDSSGYGGEQLAEIDAHPAALKLYREKMKKKYGTIESFNKYCSTDYKTFEDLGIVLTDDARKMKNFASFIEWRNFMVDVWVDAFKHVNDTYHSVAPGMPMSMENSFGQRALCGNDYWKLLTKAGFGFSNEYTDAVHDDPIRGFSELYRSFRPDMRVWGYIGYSFGRDAALFKPWWFALHRFGGLSFYDATGEIPHSVSWNLVNIPQLGLTEKGKLLKDGISDLRKGIGKLFLDYDWAKRDIAILYSQPAMLTAWCLGTENTKLGLKKGSPYHDYFYSRYSLKNILEELLYQYDFVAPEQLAEGKLKSYKILFLPHILAISDNTVSNIRDFMNKGGIVISDIIPGTYNEMGVPRENNPFLQDLDKKKNIIILDGIFDKSRQDSYTKLYEVLKSNEVLPILASDKTPYLKGREVFHFTKGDLDTFAVTRDYRRASDNEEQTFFFPKKRHVYDIRKGKYIGETDKISCSIPVSETVVFGSYPYKVDSLDINLSERIKAGTDLNAKFKINASTGKPGDHVFHLEIISPSGKESSFMKYNISAPSGTTDFSVRMAENDEYGIWTLKVKDVLSGAFTEKKFQLLKKD